MNILFFSKSVPGICVSVNDVKPGFKLALHVLTGISSDHPVFVTHFQDNYVIFAKGYAYSTDATS